MMAVPAMGGTLWDNGAANGTNGYSNATAGVFGFRDRGVLREGAFADLVLFDPDQVMDEASFTSPESLSRGIRKVWVNGCLSYDEGIATGQGGGRVLRRETSATA